MSKGNQITIEDLARMVAKGFQETASDTNSLRSEMNERFEKVDKRFEKVDKRFEKLEDIMERMDREMVKKYDLEYILSKHDGRITKVEKHLSLK